MAYAAFVTWLTKFRDWAVDNMGGDDSMKMAPVDAFIPGLQRHAYIFKDLEPDFDIGWFVGTVQNIATKEQPTMAALVDWESMPTHWETLPAPVQTKFRQGVCYIAQVLSKVT